MNCGQSLAKSADSISVEYGDTLPRFCLDLAATLPHTSSTCAGCAGECIVGFFLAKSADSSSVEFVYTLPCFRLDLAATLPHTSSTCAGCAGECIAGFFPVRSAVGAGTQYTPQPPLCFYCFDSHTLFKPEVFL